MTGNYSTQARWWGFHHDQEDYEDCDDYDDDDYDDDDYDDDNLDDNDVAMMMTSNYNTQAGWYDNVNDGNKNGVDNDNYVAMMSNQACWVSSSCYW